MTRSEFVHRAVIDIAAEKMPTYSRVTDVQHDAADIVAAAECLAEALREAGVHFDDTTPKRQKADDTRAERAVKAVTA